MNRRTQDRALLLAGFALSTVIVIAIGADVPTQFVQILH